MFKFYHYNLVSWATDELYYILSMVSKCVEHTFDHKRAVASCFYIMSGLQFYGSLTSLYCNGMRQIFCIDEIGFLYIIINYILLCILHNLYMYIFT